MDSLVRQLGRMTLFKYAGVAGLVVLSSVAEATHPHYGCAKKAPFKSDEFFDWANCEWDMEHPQLCKEGKDKKMMTCQITCEEVDAVDFNVPTADPVAGVTQWTGTQTNTPTTTEPTTTTPTTTTTSTTTTTTTTTPAHGQTPEGWCGSAECNSTSCAMTCPLPVGYYVNKNNCNEYCY